jgi:hypothetical protein
MERRTVLQWTMMTTRATIMMTMQATITMTMQDMIMTTRRQQLRRLPHLPGAAQALHLTVLLLRWWQLFWLLLHSCELLVSKRWRSFSR